MKIVMWIGNEPNQRALANKINDIFPLSGIVTETRNVQTKVTVQKIFEKIVEKIFLRFIGSAWWGMQQYYDKRYPEYPDVKILDVENINAEEAFNFSQDLEPDLILVSGTRLIKDKMLSVNPNIGILNLHTGLSPYIKGGPNCTNWCIATNQFHLIGNTIMWIDAGIDTGNLLATAFTDVNGNETFSELHLKVMEHAHSLYLNSVQFLSDGFKHSIPQNEISKGKTYYTKEWTLKQKINLALNYKKLKSYFTSEKPNQDRKTIQTIEITGAKNINQV